MRHRKKRFKLGKPRDQREALIKSLLVALVTNERIKTTYKRAKAVSSRMDKLITLGKRGDIYSRRLAYSFLQDRSLVQKLFNDIAPRFADLNGGYTRVIKVNNRSGDNALLAILEFTRIKEEIMEEKMKLKKLRREKKKKRIEEEIPPHVEGVEVKEEKVKKVKKMPQDRKEKEKKTEKDLKRKTKKGFMEGLKGFLKGKGAR